MKSSPSNPFPTPDGGTDSADSDQALRQHLRASLSTPPDRELGALQARALAQWRLRTAVQPAPHHGPLAVLQAGWRQHPALWSGAVVALGLATLLIAKPWTPAADPTLDELLQPDVLSLMADGEL